ncbi:MAG: CAAX prenyl protease-related protein [Kiritimatiellia bacterium]
MTTEQKNALVFAAPFATWIALQMLLPATAAAYALRTGATALVGLAALARSGWRPSRLSRTAWAAGAAGGLLVALVWIAPEYSAWYRTWLEYPIGDLPPPPAASPYEPATCGWTLTIVKLIGSAFVIAPVEEIFFRSFLYRWLQHGDFRSVPPSRFDLSAFLWTVFLFTLEHDRPLVAALAGAAYGFLAIRFGLGSAILAHVTTNLALALHVIHWGEWGFW